jgi:hypothetical protein
VELWFSAKASFSGRKRKDPCPFDYHFVFAPVSASGGPAWDSLGTPAQATVTAGARAGSYRLTAAIPLAGLDGVDWKSGATLRFDTSVSKSGPDGRRRSKVYWNAGDDSAAGDADQWGTAVLE